MLKNIAFTLAMLAAGLAQADSVRDYLIRAIDAGEVSGPIDDATAKAWQQQSGSSAPVMVRVTPIRNFQQEGCKRLAVVMYQDGVPTREGPKVRAGLPFEMNLCRDGTPPVEGSRTQILKAPSE